jgi:hypothetical protein
MASSCQPHANPAVVQLASDRSYSLCSNVPVTSLSLACPSFHTSTATHVSGDGRRALTCADALMQGRRSMTKSKTADLEAENATLKAQVASLTSANGALTAENGALTAENGALKVRVVNLETDLVNIKATVETVSTGHFESNRQYKALAASQAEFQATTNATLASFEAGWAEHATNASARTADTRRAPPAAITTPAQPSQAPANRGKAAPTPPAPTPAPAQQHRYWQVCHARPSTPVL